MSSGVINSGVVALVGSPNSGKTTLFNWLTGLRYNTVNYPGSTVEYSVGTTHSRYGEAVRLMDAPGVYSLFPKSPEEEITLKAILDHPTYGPAELVLSVVDATHLSRHLLTTKQLISAGFPTILAVTMIDLLREAGQKLDAEGLARELGCPVVLIEGQLGGGVVELVSKLHEFFQSGGKAVRLHSVGDWNRERIEQSIAETQDIERRVVSRTGIQKGLDSIARTARIDKYLLHPVFGIAIFLAIMSAVFTSIYWVAAPLMDFVDAGFSWVASEIINLNANPLLLDFFANGIVASFGAVLVFVPQIFILFMGIAILEDSGYLARSATIIDRPFRFFGLSGRSFVPLLSGFACAVPAMMAARSISSSRERWLTLFVIPLMSCSARLPVYALLLSFVFYDGESLQAGLALAGIYVSSLLVGALAALVAKKFLKSKGQSLFCLELPVYRRPLLMSVFRQAYSRTKNYIRRAGPIIFVLSVLIWLGTTFPHNNLHDETQRLEKSFLGQAGQLIEPIFTPMGVDWRVGVGLLSAFAAREVFVSSLAIVFSVADENQDSMQKSLLNKMREAKMADGTPVFTFSSILGLILFFMVALQCLSTTGVAVRESGAWKFAIMQLVVFNLLAYAMAVTVVQGLRFLGHF